MGKLISPMGDAIVGTCDTVQLRANVSSWTKAEDGTLTPTYAGGSDVWWDTQATRNHEPGDMLVQDEMGDEWPLSACTYVEDDACATCAASIETRNQPCDECGHLDEED